MLQNDIHQLVFRLLPLRILRIDHHRVDSSFGKIRVAFLHNISKQPGSVVLIIAELSDIAVPVHEMLTGSDRQRDRVGG